MKTIQRFFDWFVFLLTGGGNIAKDAINAGLIDYSGQGRDKYGR